MSSSLTPAARSSVANAAKRAQLRRGASRRVVRLPGKAALARHGAEIALGLQLPIGPLDRVGVDGQCPGQLPHRGQLFPWRKNARDDQIAQCVIDLFIDRPRIAEIDMDQIAALLSVLTVLTVSIQL